MFDQGDRIEQSISAADVADVCLRSLRNPEACNKVISLGLTLTWHRLDPDAPLLYRRNRPSFLSMRPLLSRCPFPRCPLADI